MITLKINGLPSCVDDGATVLDAAKLVFAEIPTLCHMKGFEPETSCMICVVKNIQTGQLIPACSTKVMDGMEIDTDCEEVHVARRDILNLLLSEHVGDCHAPCSRICPAHLDIPLMLREIERGNLESAAWIAIRDLAIPMTLGYVCSAPCEKGCRRGQVDQPITIQKLHREVVFAHANCRIPAVSSEAAPKAAVIGSGPAGLSCAWKLRQLGYQCTIFDEAQQAGGRLLEDKKLPIGVLEDELAWLASHGIQFILGDPISLHEITSDYDGVIFAATEFPGIHFADAIYAKEHKLAVKSVGNGKEAALALDLRLKGEVASDIKRFDSKIGLLHPPEIIELQKNCAFHTADCMVTEAARCLHCDCRKPESCKLRTYAEQYGADQYEFKADERKQVQLFCKGHNIVFEPGKCIKCGLCIRVSKRAGEKLGMTMLGRGYDAHVAVPFNNAIQDGLKICAEECIKICPTGALAYVDAEEVIQKN